jgi:lipopolysaccharide/colanic/teichoic acid biosynthesis glycosyltransferase
MFFNRLTHRIRNAEPPKTESRPEFLHSSERFFALLEAERLRSDRANSIFTLVVFKMTDNDIHGEAVNSEAASRFLDGLQQRLRATDHAGFFGKVGPGIGVILWDTDSNGANQFATAMRITDGDKLFPAYEIYTYPSEPDTLDKKSESDSKQSITNKQLTNKETPQTQPLEMFFMKPLPWWKRTVDIFAASAGLIVLSPLLLLTAILIKLTSRGPIFFLQQRDGLGSRPFWILKFRTMCIDAESQKDALRQFSEQDGPAFKLTKDPRVTRIGRYLRKTCIDELPQLWNILKGDMTLVGPRPLPTNESQKIVTWGRRRLEVTPGLTCIWQVHGKSKVSFLEWMRMDIRYIKVRTFFKDMKLVIQTAIAVILHRASQ